MQWNLSLNGIVTKICAWGMISIFLETFDTIYILTIEVLKIALQYLTEKSYLPYFLINHEIIIILKPYIVQFRSNIYDSIHV